MREIAYWWSFDSLKKIRLRPRIDLLLLYLFFPLNSFSLSRGALTRLFIGDEECRSQYFIEFLMVIKMIKYRMTSLRQLDKWIY